MRNQWVLKAAKGGWWHGKKPKNYNDGMLYACHDALETLGVEPYKPRTKITIHATKTKRKNSTIIWVKKDRWHTCSWTALRCNRDIPSRCFVPRTSLWINKHFPELQDGLVHKYYVSATQEEL